MQREDPNPQGNSTKEQQEKNILLMATIPIGTLMNLGLGALTQHLKLPVYLDATGTLVVTVFMGIPAGIATGVSSSLLGGLLINPMVPYYTGTLVALAIVGGVMAKRGFFRSLPRVILTGILLGIVAGIVSAPITIKLFGGATGTGVDILTAFQLATGKSIAKSVFATNFFTEPLDKTLQCLIVFWLIKSLPRTLRNYFMCSGYLRRNF